jgi:hypothetical protein
VRELKVGESDYCRTVSLLYSSTMAKPLPHVETNAVTPIFLCLDWIFCGGVRAIVALSISFVQWVRSCKQLLSLSLLYY